jgi:hypothetical protein
VTHLRKIMMEELQRRNYSKATARYYIRKVEAFARHFQCSPDRLGPQHIREYQAYLFTKQKLSPGSVTTHLCALRFFYIQTLKKPWSIADTPYPKKNHRLPTILSQEEVAQLIDAASTPFHRTLLMPIGSGSRPLHHSDPVRPSRSERNRDLSPSFATSPSRHRQSSGLAPVESVVTAGGVDESAAPGTGRFDPHCRNCFRRAQSPVDTLAAHQSPAGHCPLPHCGSRWPYR